MDSLNERRLFLEHACITVAAISGVLAARGKRIDLFGVLVLALVTAFGGGTVRDLLVGDLPPVWLRNSAFLLNASITALVTFFLIRVRSLPATFLLVADAFALALFTILGTQKGIAVPLSGPVSILLGVITGVAGGIIRDVLTGELPLVFRPEIHLYATAALTGAAFHVIFHKKGFPEPWITLLAIAIILTMRLAALRWRISLPLFEMRDPNSTPTSPPHPNRPR